MLTNIIHLSDIHIRIGGAVKSRYHEYNSVFVKLFESLSQHSSIKNKTSIIVITGDIFHHKNKVEPYALELAITLLQGLASLASVYVIRGNHDYRQDLPSEHDMISALMSYHIDNVTYLDKTGIYPVQNIDIGLVAIQDTLLYGSTSGISSNLPPFPVPSISEKKHYSVALFHGSISGSTLQNGTEVHSTLHGYPIDWFQGYDAILLGDIHVQQIKRATIIEYQKDSIPHTTHTQTYSYSTPSPWGYPGSLIQQDFGESIFGHGFVIWDLQNRLIHTYHLHNTDGYVKLRLQHKQIEILHRDVSNNPIFVPIESIISEKWFPSTISVNVMSCCDTESMKYISDYLQSHGKTILQIKKPHDTPETPVKIDESKSDDLLTKINSIDLLIEYIQSTIQKNKVDIPDVWKLWMKHPENMIISVKALPDGISKKINEKSDKILKLSSKYIEDFEAVQTKQFISGSVCFNYLEWNWILNYKQSNRFNFDTREKHISILNSKNGFGKSNFLEVICIALFGEGFPSRYNKNHSSGIICDKKPHGAMASTVITFTVNDKKYTLKRILRSHDKRTIGFLEVILSEHNALSSSILHQGQTAVNQWVTSNIGTISMYLMSDMLSQNADSDFFSLDKPKQKMLLDQILSLDHINSLQTLLKSSVTYYKSIAELSESYHEGISQKSIADPIIVEKLSTSKSELLETHSISQSLFHKWNHIAESNLYSSNIHTIQIEHDALKCKADSIETLPIDQLTQHKHDILSRRSSLQQTLSSLHSFSDLKNHAGKSLHLYTSANYLEQLHIFKNEVTLHPYSKSGTFDIYQDIDTIYEHVKNTPTSIDAFALMTTVQEFQTWDKIQTAHFADKIYLENDTELILQNKITLLADTIQHSSLNLQLHIKTSLRLKKQVVKLRKEKDLLSDNRPNKPSVTIQWLDSFKLEIETHGSLETALQRRDTLSTSIQQIPIQCNHITTLLSKINEIESYIQECVNVPFNAKCSACKQQGWKVKYDSYCKELPQLFSALDTATQILHTYAYDTLSTLTIDSHTEYISKLNVILQNTNSYISSYNTYIHELTLYEEYTQWNTLYDILKRKLDPIEAEYDASEKQIKHHTDIITCNTADKHSIESTIAQIQLRKSEYIAYQSEYQHRVKEYTLATDQLSLSWFYHLYNYREMVTLSISMLVKEIQQCDTDITNNDIAVQNATLKDSLQRQVLHMHAVLDAYPSWVSWKQYSAKEKELNLIIRELETQLRGTSTSSNTSPICLIIENAKQYAHVASWMGTIFEDYRKWLYTSYIAPMIHSKVNNILSMISDDTLLLDSEWLDTIDTLSWFIKNGSSRVILEKASGFQRFIVGIALRVTFHQIGFCRVRFDQLFIDEGFTTCDSDNLEKVPSFLDGLLQFYNSIYLVTHLDDLKSCTDHHIYITRDTEGLSQIQYGDEHSDIKESIKKRGRPSKNTVVLKE